DAKKRQVTLDVPEEEIAKRMAKWKQPKPNYKRGTLAKYAHTVSSAHLGAVTDILD
ncbi:MAG: dihydroxy-acid dehydratase, partial [Verrucomicrobia bacterium]|nr:dihydroxy-acid dehydratase [Verrucomicrobiota bacterium]